MSTQTTPEPDHTPSTKRSGALPFDTRSIHCGVCGRAWAEDITPAGRCPWEDLHEPDEPTPALRTPEEIAAMIVNDNTVPDEWSPVLMSTVAGLAAAAIEADRAQRGVGQ